MILGEEELVPEVLVINEAESSAAAVTGSVNNQRASMFPDTIALSRRNRFLGGQQTTYKRGSCGHQRQATT